MRLREVEGAGTGGVSQGGRAAMESEATGRELQRIVAPAVRAAPRLRSPSRWLGGGGQSLWPEGSPPPPSRLQVLQSP